MEAPTEARETPASQSEEAPEKQVSVKVTNLSASATVKDLQGHFAYAGTIASIYLKPGVDGAPAEAHVTFSEAKALETALLLTDSSIKGTIVKVEEAEAGYSPPHDATFFGSAPPPKPEGAVKVTNLASSTTAADLQDFFAFAGTVCSIEITSGQQGEPGDAFVSFYEKKAVETAVLLTDAKVKGSIVTVSEAPEYTPHANAKYFPPPNKALEGQNPVKAAEAMVRRLVEQGYTLSASTAQKARDFDSKHQLTRSATTKVVELRDSAAAAASSAMSTIQQRLLETPAAASSAVSTISQKIMETPSLFKPLQEGTEQVDKTFESVDKSYHVTEKTQGVISIAEKQLNDIGAYFLQNKYLAQAKDYIEGTAAKVSDAVETGLERATSKKFNQGLEAGPDESGNVVQQESTGEGGGEEAKRKEKESLSAETKEGASEVNPLLKETDSADDSVAVFSAAADPAKGGMKGEASKSSGKIDSPSAEPLVAKAVPEEDDTPVF